MQELVLIGEAPGRQAERCYPLFPYPPRSAGARLYRMSPFNDGMCAGMAAYVCATHRLNLLPECPDESWPARQARAQARNLLRSGLLQRRRTILCGRRVAEAFFREAFSSDLDYEPLTWYRLLATPRVGQPKEECMAHVGYIPHPSGRNRWYNDPDNKRAAEEFLREAFDLCGYSE